METEYYYPHSGRDPQLMEMQCRYYGVNLVVVPDRLPVHPLPLWGSNAQALGVCSFELGLALCVVRCLRRGAVIVSLIGLFGTLHAYTGSGSRNGFSWSVSATATFDGNTVTVNGTLTSNGAIGGFQVYTTDASGTTVGTDSVDYGTSNKSLVASGTKSSSFPKVWLDIFGQDQSAPDEGTNIHFGPFDITPTVGYKVTFHLPKNETGGVVHYTAMQDGASVATTTTDPGEAAHDWEITGLVNDHSVTLLLQNSVKEWGDDPLHPGQITLLGESLGQAQQAGQGTPSVDGATASGGNASGPAPVFTKPAFPTPDAPHVLPKADSPAPPSVVHVLHPNSSPSGTSGVTKADLEQQTNDLADVSNGVMDAEKANAGAVIDAINSQKAADTDNANGVIDATNKVKDAVDTLRGSIDQANGDSSSSGGGGSGTAPKPSDATSLIDVTGDIASSAVGKLPGAPGFSGMDASSTIPIVVHIPVPGKSDIVFEKTIDFAEAPYHGPITIFRGLMLVLVTIGFFLASFWTVRGAFTTTK